MPFFKGVITPSMVDGGKWMKLLTPFGVMGGNPSLFIFRNHYLF
jgi:hypothetical protein